MAKNKNNKQHHSGGSNFKAQMAYNSMLQKITEQCEEDIFQSQNEEVYLEGSVKSDGHFDFKEASLKLIGGNKEKKSFTAEEVEGILTSFGECLNDIFITRESVISEEVRKRMPSFYKKLNIVA